MRYHLFQKFFGKMVKIKETSFNSIREDTNFLPPLYYKERFISTLLYLINVQDGMKILGISTI